LEHFQCFVLSNNIEILLHWKKTIFKWNNLIMDQMELEIVKEVTRGGVEIAKDFAYALLGKSMEEVGGILSDSLHGYKVMNQARVLLKTKESIELLGLDPVAIKPDFFLPLLDACAYIENEELATMYSKLLVSHLDSSKVGHTHTAFISIIKEMTPFDAYVFSRFYQYQINEMEDLLQLGFADGAYVANLITPRAVGVLIFLESQGNPHNPSILNAGIFNLKRLGLLTEVRECSIAKGVVCFEEEITLVNSEASRRNVEILKDYANIDFSKESYETLSKLYEEYFFTGLVSPFGKIFGDVCI